MPTPPVRGTPHPFATAMHQLELGGTVPTVPLLARLARAMESELHLKLVGETSQVVFTAHEHEAA
ncbi:hypothetical protein [Streptomyces goshikiensis]|uniref:hypothetical protein n=1 Tax=Streptomyces goshikiensis TaxID=1942 RepID=UPI00369B4D08